MFRVEFLPLVEAGGRNDAASALEGLTICARGGDGLGTRVDGGDAFDVSEVLGEERNQAPAQRNQLALAGVAIIADDGLHAGRSDVVVPGWQREVVDLGGVEGLGDLLFVGLSVVPAAHALDVQIVEDFLCIAVGVGLNTV